MPAVEKNKWGVWLLSVGLIWGMTLSIPEGARAQSRYDRDSERGPGEDSENRSGGRYDYFQRNERRPFVDEERGGDRRSPESGRYSEGSRSSRSSRNEEENEICPRCGRRHPLPRSDAGDYRSGGASSARERYPEESNREGHSSRMRGYSDRDSDRSSRYGEGSDRGERPERGERSERGEPSARGERYGTYDRSERPDGDRESASARSGRDGERYALRRPSNAQRPDGQESSDADSGRRTGRNRLMREYEGEERPDGGGSGRGRDSTEEYASRRPDRY